MISSFRFALITHDALNRVRWSIICKNHTFGLLFHSFKSKATVSLKVLANGKLTIDFGFGFLYFWQTSQLLFMFLTISNNCLSFMLASFNRVISLSLEGWLNWRCNLIAIFCLHHHKIILTHFSKLDHDCHLLFFLLKYSHDLRWWTLLLVLFYLILSYHLRNLCRCWPFSLYLC